MDPDVLTSHVSSLMKSREESRLLREKLAEAQALLNDRDQKYRKTLYALEDEVAKLKEKLSRNQKVMDVNKNLREAFEKDVFMLAKIATLLEQREADAEATKTENLHLQKDKQLLEEQLNQARAELDRRDHDHALYAERLVALERAKGTTATQLGSTKLQMRKEMEQRTLAERQLKEVTLLLKHKVKEAENLKTELDRERDNHQRAVSLLNHSCRELEELHDVRNLLFEEGVLESPVKLNTSLKHTSAGERTLHRSHLNDESVDETEIVLEQNLLDAVREELQRPVDPPRIDISVAASPIKEEVGEIATVTPEPPEAPLSGMDKSNQKNYRKGSKATGPFSHKLTDDRRLQFK